MDSTKIRLTKDERFRPRLGPLQLGILRILHEREDWCDTDALKHLSVYRGAITDCLTTMYRAGLVDRKLRRPGLERGRVYKITHRGADLLPRIPPNSLGGQGGES